MGYHMHMRNKPTSVGEQAASNMMKDQRIELLEAKVKAMRSLLVEWNPSSGQVWEQKRMIDVGETASDYADFIDFDDDDEMPLFDVETHNG